MGFSERWNQEFSNRTVKASTFGPHGNFRPSFQKSLLLSKRVLHLKKMYGMNVVDNLSIVTSVLFIFGTESTQRNYGSSKKWSKVSVMSKVRGFYCTNVASQLAKLISVFTSKVDGISKAVTFHCLVRATRQGSACTAQSKRQGTVSPRRQRFSLYRCCWPGWTPLPTR